MFREDLVVFKTIFKNLITLLIKKNKELKGNKDV